MEAWHQGCELVGDVLQDFRVFFQGSDEAGVGFEQFSGDGEGGQFLEGGEEVGAGGAGVGGAEEEAAVGAGVDGVEVGDFGCGSTHGVCECLALVSVFVAGVLCDWRTLLTTMPPNE